MAKTLDKEVEEAILKLRGIAKALNKKERQKALKEGAVILQQEVRKNIKDSDAVHFRYNTPKVVARLKAPKGMGKKEAEYHPGNLRRSIKVLTFRRSEDVFVGHKISKRGKGSGVFKGNRVDGWYLWFLEMGTRFISKREPVRRAFEARKVEVSRKVVTAITNVIAEYVNKNKV